MKMKFPEGVTHFNRADGSVLLRDETAEVEVDSEAMRLELMKAGFQEVVTELAFPGTDDTRTIQEVDALIKGENAAGGEQTGDTSTDANTGDE
jgi:hypothetical protein